MAGSLDNLSFLVVDDNYNMCRIMESILRGFGIREIAAITNVPRALEEMYTRNFDIAIVDHIMEPMDGLEFTQLVRTASDSRNPYLPIILMTGFTQRRRINEVRDAGITAILAKPVRPIDLYKRIVHVIEKPRPFIRSPRYTGPDRRLKNSESYTGPERRKQAN